MGNNDLGTFKSNISYQLIFSLFILNVLNDYKMRKIYDNIYDIYW